MGQVTIASLLLHNHDIARYLVRQSVGGCVKEARGAKAFEAAAPTPEQDH